MKMQELNHKDSDLTEDLDDKQNTMGYIITLRSKMVSWVFRLQKIVSLFITEAKYVIMTKASKEMIWLQSFLAELGNRQGNDKLYSDSMSIIHLVRNVAFHVRTKHITKIQFYTHTPRMHPNIFEEDTHYWKSYKHINQGCNLGESKIVIGFNWSSWRPRQGWATPQPRTMKDITNLEELDRLQ